MKLKTYQAWSMPEAIAYVKSDLGEDAVILHTRTFERGGFLGFGRRTVVEITAGRAQDMPPTGKQSGKQPPKARRPVDQPATDGAAPTPVVHRAALGAYGAPAAKAGRSPTRSTASDEPVLDMAAERERTRRLALAMSIKLEKEAAERKAATRNEAMVDAVARATAPRRASESAPEPAETPAPVSSAAQRFVLQPEARGSSTLVTLATPTASVASASFTAPTPAATPAAIPAATPAPVPDSVATPPAAAAPPDASNELDAIAAFVGRVLEGERAAPAPCDEAPPSRPVEDSVYARLIGEEVAESLARRIAREIADECSDGETVGAAEDRSCVDRGCEDWIGEGLEKRPAQRQASNGLPMAVHEALLRRLASLVPEDDGDLLDIVPGRHGPRRIAFIGPTGVGKTTTLAKVAAQLKLRRGLEVGIVAADTYRIAAVEQLRTYAEILGLPVEVAASPREATEACARLGDVDVILVDTAGRSQNDCMKLSELRAFLQAVAPDETHLVLSATASARTLEREASAFGDLGVDRLALTKLDEAAAYGTLVSLVARLGTKLSFLTDGQEVPDHLEQARGVRLASLLLEASSTPGRPYAGIDA